MTERPLAPDGNELRIRPIILSGGTGTRLWPLSRSGYPKQLLPLAASETMLQMTVRRVVGDQFQPVVVVADEQHRFFITDQLEKIGAEPAAVLLEPSGRNTAAAAAIAAQWCLDRGEDTPLLVMPSDHVITDQRGFHAALERAVSAAAKGALVTFGIKPSGPKTGYGYIEVGAPLDGSKDVFKVASFVEKPSHDLATRYLENGRYCWNSGIFLFRPSSLMREFGAHAPDIGERAAEAVRHATTDGSFVRPEPAIFDTIEAISIDCAVMEKTQFAAVVPVDMGWSDVGTWEALWDIAPKDDRGNVIQGDVLVIDSNDCLLRSETDGALAVIGLQGMAVVVTRDAVLATPLRRSDDVKSLVATLNEQGSEAAISSTITYRPWGSYQTMDRGERYQTKHIMVKPGAALSLQKHNHRSEHWVVVTGTAEVTVGDEVKLLQENESTYIPAGTKHRLANPGRVPLHLIEVQCGPYLGEDDIVRLHDDYGRS